MSFNDEVEFSMIAGKGRTLKEHVIKAKGRNDINLLKNGVIYGANASGKSNLIKAMLFAKDLIIDGTKHNKPIAINNFKLDKNSLNKPSKFEFDIKYKDVVYSYGFTLNSSKIISEWLYEIDKVKDKLIFKRKTLENNDIYIEFGNINFKNKEEKQFIDFVAKGTRKNQLFLTESIERNVKSVQDFINVYEWFNEVLSFVFPDSKDFSIIHSLKINNEIQKVIQNFLDIFDTGISQLEPIEVDINKIISSLPSDIIINFSDKFLGLENGSKGILNINNDTYGYSKDKQGNNTMFKLMSKHKSKDLSNDILFELSEESDGTQRLMDIIPILISISLQHQVFIIDELDRSLHPLLISKFLDVFSKINKNNSQIIFTTHQSTLLNLDILRKDEIWFIEKNQYGESNIYSLEEYNPRYDKDIRKGYLSGRFGAIPLMENNLEDLVKNG
ncbi:MAG: ATP-binding protein [Cyanobacteriota bacterium]